MTHDFPDKSLTRPGGPLQVTFWWLTWLAISLPGLLWFRWGPGGAPRAVPRRGPFLLLANHTAVYDPVWVAWWGGRRVSYMSLETLFHHWFLGRFLPLVGCFPKAYAVKDRGSMAALEARYRAGEGVVIFPEGGRSWDGRPGEVLPGIGRLVKRLGGPVVLARVETGHLFQPRWARYPRWVPVRIRYSRLPELSESAEPEAITAAIRSGLAIDPDVDAPGWSFGWRMAHGLPDYLWACPACFAPEALEVDPGDGDRVLCGACGGAWRLDTSNRMRGEGAPSWRVTQARDRIVARFGPRPRLGSGEALLEHGDARVLRLPRDGQRQEIARGRLRLGPAGLTLEEPAGDRRWRAPFSRVSVVAVAFGNLLTVRVDEALFGVELIGGNALLWGHFTRRWHALSQA